MALAVIILQQTCVMLLLMGGGFFLYKKGLVSPEGSRSLAHILVWLVIPSVFITSFQGRYSQQNLYNLFYSAAVSGALLAVSLVCARLFYKESPIDRFAAAFSNAGFIGIPLVTAVLGTEAVFLIAPFIILLNTLQYTYGNKILAGKDAQISVKKTLLNPITIGALLALATFFSPIGLPEVLSKSIGYIAGMNTPVAMLVLGVYLAQSDVKSLFTTPRLYGVYCVRLLLIPIASAAILWALPVDPVLKTALFIVCAAPVGSNVAVYTQLSGLDYTYACRTVTLTTLMSILTFPLLTGLTTWLWTV